MAVLNAFAAGAFYRFASTFADQRAALAAATVFARNSFITSVLMCLNRRPCCRIACLMAPLHVFPERYMSAVIVLVLASFTWFEAGLLTRFFALRVAQWPAAVAICPILRMGAAVGWCQNGQYR